jgi:hypothetical protein
MSLGGTAAVCCHMLSWSIRSAFSTIARRASSLFWCKTYAVHGTAMEVHGRTLAALLVVTL